MSQIREGLAFRPLKSSHRNKSNKKLRNFLLFPDVQFKDEGEVPLNLFVKKIVGYNYSLLLYKRTLAEYRLE